LQGQCAGRGVILVVHGGGEGFRTTPGPAERLQSAFRHHRLTGAAVEVLVVGTLHQPLSRPLDHAIALVQLRWCRVRFLVRETAAASG